MSQVRKAKAKAADLPQFDAVLPMTRRAQIAETLRNSILSGRLAPGTQLVESKLATRFGVSRGSIREAIWELIDRGLLVNRPYAGTFVASLDAKTTAEVFSLRCALERYCFAELWPKRDETFRKEFTQRYSSLVKTVRARKYFDTIEAELHFHSYPYEFCGNQTLLDVWHQLSQKIQLSFVICQAVERGVEFKSDGDRYTKSFVANTGRYIDAALGDDLDKMLREIDRHLELGLIAVMRQTDPLPTPRRKNGR
jgi:DNA-binding GntR family transcriptional regulator